MPEHPVVRKADLCQAAGQLAGVQPEPDRSRRQLEHGGDKVVQKIHVAVFRAQDLLFREAEARVVIDHWLQQGRRIRLLLVGGMGGKVGLYLLLQAQAAGGQPGVALVCQPELLFQIVDPALQGRGVLRSCIVHNRILLIFLIP